MRVDVDVCECGHLRSEHGLRGEHCHQCDCAAFEYDHGNPDNSEA